MTVLKTTDYLTRGGSSEEFRCLYPETFAPVFNMAGSNDLPFMVSDVEYFQGWTP